MTPGYLAKLADVPVSEVYRALRMGDLEGVQIRKNGQRWYIEPDEALSWARWVRRYGTKEN